MGGIGRLKPVMINATGCCRSLTLPEAEDSENLRNSNLRDWLRTFAVAKHKMDHGDCPSPSLPLLPRSLGHFGSTGVKSALSLEA